MRVDAAIKGNLPEFMKKQVAAAETAVTSGVKEVSENVKAELRAQVVSAGLGVPMSKTWKTAYYPKGKKTLSATGIIFPDMPQVIRAFSEGALIRSKNGFFLAIPTPAAPKRGIGGKRISPSNFPEASLGRLRFVYRPGKVSLLVVDNLRAGTGKRGGFRKASESAQRTGRGLATVVMFFLVPQAKITKRLDYKTVAKKWEPRLGQAILDNWPEEKTND